MFGKLSILERKCMNKKGKYEQEERNEKREERKKAEEIRKTKENRERKLRILQTKCLWMRMLRMNCQKGK